MCISTVYFSGCNVTNIDINHISNQTVFQLTKSQEFYIYKYIPGFCQTMTSLCLNLCNLTIVNFLSLLCLCRPFHDDNLKTTKYIRNFVAALHPNLENCDTLSNSKCQPNFLLSFYNFCET